MSPRVVAVSRAKNHGFSKPNQLFIRLVEGLGVDGDAHAGRTVRHRSRVVRDATTPNLRQVHLMHAELFAELKAKGYDIAPGALGENVTTEGLDVLALPAGARLTLGADAVVEVTGLRNPCIQIERYREGLLDACRDRAPDGGMIRKAGIMGVVLAGGEVWPGDPIGVELPAGTHRPLEVV